MTQVPLRPRALRVSRFRTRMMLAGALVCAASLQLVKSQTPPPPVKTMLGDDSAGSRSRPAHVIPLRDPEGDTIQPGDRRPLPFSSAQTCGGDCHSVGTISRGWHFNAALPGVPAGRNGQPWLLVDRATATQIPLSYRAWQGTYRPSQVGLTDLDFATHFGGRTPGGLPPNPTGSPAGWAVSGSLEVNCLVCHDASPAYDQAEFARQVTSRNFRWAATAASGLGQVTGSAKEMPDFFDYLLPNSVEDSLQPKVPRVEYAGSQFLAGGKVAFDIVRDVKAERCYYCHTNVDVEQTGAARWKAAEDVHLARGITCVECHRNGLDHAMTRNYEGDPAAVHDPFATTLSCRGCHMGSDSDSANTPGRMGAPHPEHAGIPPVHFEKLTCTACHSGPWPADNTRSMKNGMTHGLAEFNANRSPQAMPHIEYPVFARQPDGKIGPNRIVWPAFWARRQGGTVAPINPEEVAAVLKKGKLEKTLAADGGWPAVDEQWVAAVLRLLGSDAVYIAGGKLRSADGSGRLTAEDSPLAQPYLWPIGHDVRPASQALGAKSCQDCHSTQAAIFFGNVAVDSPLAADRGTKWKMNRFEKGLDISYNTTLAQAWVYRPWLKAAGIVAAGLLALLLLAYAVRGASRLSAATASQAALSASRWLRMAVNLAALGSFGLIAGSGVYAYLSTGSLMTGGRLMLHMTAAPVFAAAAVALGIFWADRNRFASEDWKRMRRPLAAVVPLRKLFFWVAAVLSVPAIVSMILAMYPLAGTDQQELLFRIHRWSALPLTVAGLLFACFALLAWRERSAD